MNNTNNKKINWTEKELGTLKTRVMRRVYLDWFFGKVALPALVILPLAGFLLVRELSQITVRNIIETSLIKLFDMNLAGIVNYYVAAIRFTEIDSLLILSSSMLLAAIFGRRLIRDAYTFWFRNNAFSLSEARFRRS